MGVTQVFWDLVFGFFVCVQIIIKIGTTANVLKISNITAGPVDGGEGQRPRHRGMGRAVPASEVFFAFVLAGCELLATVVPQTYLKK